MSRFTLLKKAKEIGVVTERYPYKPTEVPEGFRGKPEIDPEKCIGCCACIAACPPNALTSLDENGYRIIRIFYGRCIFCGRCADVCPEEAIRMTEEFELTADDHEDLIQEVRLKLVRCSICGRYYDTERHYKMILKEFEEAGLKVDSEVLRRCPEHRMGMSAEVIGLRRVRK